MISWIQNHLIRHGRWIFLTLLSVIIVAFVFTIGNTPGCTSDQSAYRENNFYGYDLNSPREMGIISEKVSLSSILNTGRPIQSEQQFQSEVMSRIALLHLANEIGIPTPNQKTLELYIMTKAAFRGPDGQFSRDAYTSFVDNIESNPRMPQGLFVVVLEENYRIDQVRDALGGPGYALPSEALAQTERNETTLKLATAEINYADFTPEVTAEESVLKDYYTANPKRYEIAERIQASYITFPATKYADQVVAPEQAELRDHFIANRAAFVTAYEAAQPKPDNLDAEKPAVTFEDVREAVATDLAGQAAMRIANQAAQSFAYTLYRDNIEQDSAAFNTLLNESNLTITEIPPYSAEDAARRALSTEMLEAAFTLTQKRYFSDAYAIDGGFGVLIYKGRKAPEIPAFDTVAAVVKADYTAEEKRRLFNENGVRLETELKDKIATGSTFIEAAEMLSLKASESEAFKINEAPRTFNRAALQKAQSMATGEVSPMLTSGDIGVFVYIEEKLVPEIEADDETLSQAQDFLKRYATYVSSAALINELIASGIEIPAEADEAVIE
jgi:peptidyl-prolyl cis-trans isomerase D